MGLPFFEKNKKGTAPAKKNDVKASGLSLREEDDKKKDVAPVQRARVTRKFPVAEQKVLLRPVMTGKAFAEGRELYIFEVAKTAGKVEIRKAFYNVYGVMPKKVRTQRYGSREIHFGRIRGMSKEWKKAIVTLEKGETVHIV